MLFGMVMWGCTARQATPPAPVAVAVESSGARLSRHLIGRFDSAEQAAADAENYYPISLVMCRAEAPDIGRDVLYVEQAVVGREDAPYRQRLYVIEDIDAQRARSRIFELSEPDAFVGACDSGVPTASAAEATEKPGCAVEMTWAGATAAGGTQGTGCATALNGAAYATSEITLAVGALTSWDRGFFADGEQAWGAEAGPYIFVRRTPLQPE